ncbi:putative bifunctional diguanylate cyclase/phosphodiesterase [Synechococcus sp. BA-132 BA5]|uniref:putative bifunctional diguanylate cyclase/phosphodiesterase n=1 Tax=Synechococcus sp. BA-132 BA5 TaxID=3110252 RepID=UPI002B1F2815|nr:GGDEF domain-containing phosphodiesterase [Synechococcus sp. BA-132 BA5]MEA5413942.1 GGDEF domain-containing phosphodiesterase [Synechococcus sp. BA-132 BA5]
MAQDLQAKDFQAGDFQAGDGQRSGSGAVAGLLERIEQPAALADAQGAIVAANGAFCRRSGLELAALRQRGLQALCAADVTPLLQGAVASLSSELVTAPGAEAAIPLALTRLPATNGPEVVWCLLELLDQRVTLADLDNLVLARYADGVVLMHLQLLQLDLVRGRLGIAACEALIEEIAHRLETALPAGGFYSRQGGDRLLVLLPGAMGIDAVRDVAGTLLASLEAPTTVLEHVIEPSLNVGISRAPDDGKEFSVLLEAATRALEETHRQPFPSCCIASPVERSVQLQQLLARPLALAIEQEQLELAYQPIIELETGRVIAAEVLCRWDDPVLGRQSPADFIDVAEATAQISSLGRWVMERAFEALHRWDGAGLQLGKICINVSPLQVQDPSWSSDLLTALERHQLTPGRIVLELTEGSILEMSDHVANQLRDLRRQGFELAMDDFGTGYSGLQRLTELPFSEVKIDRSLISAIDYDQLQQAMLSAVIRLSDATGIMVVVEGVERSRQRQMLLSLGCRHGQGYQLSAPLSDLELEALLQSQITAEA